MRSDSPPIRAPTKPASTCGTCARAAATTGYYINVGCAELIADGKIGLVDAETIDTFIPEGLRMLGYEIAERIGLVWGFDENHVMKNMWQQTPNRISG